jgi:hypothetical protein
MTVPAKITASLTALQAQVAAAAPLQAAPYSALRAIQLNANRLEADTTLALYDAAGQLDTWIAPPNQPGMISGFQAMVESALDEWRILDMLAVISRAALNIDLLVGDLGTIPAQRTTIIPS